MVSAAERLVANLNFSAFGKAEELKRRILFVIGALIVYRIGTYIPLPGIETDALRDLYRQHSGGVLGMLNMFAGGALERMTIFALNVMPYITASIIMMMLTTASPVLEAMKKEGPAGQRRINQYTRYLTVALAGFQGYGIAVGLEGMTSALGPVVLEPGWQFRSVTVITLIGGTMFLMWLGEQMTARGIGNGISLIIFAGIVAGLPGALAGTFELGRKGALHTGFIVLLILLALGLLMFIVFVERALRRIVVQYPKRQVGNKLYAGEQSHLPLKVNTAGVMPPIIASSLLLFPATIAAFNTSGSDGGGGLIQTLTTFLAHGHPVYIATYAALTVFFAFFFASMVFKPVDTADNLKKNGGFIPGIRPGKPTAEYLEYVLTRITVVGAVYLAVVCTIPELLIAHYAVPFYLGGTSLLIVVNVCLDTVTQIQSHLFAHQYEHLIRKAKLKGRGTNDRRIARPARGR